MIGDQYSKFFSLIDEKQGSTEVTTNMACISCNSIVNSKKCVIDSCASQHMTHIECLLENKFDVLKLDLRVDHPNRA